MVRALVRLSRRAGRRGRRGARAPAGPRPGGPVLGLEPVFLGSPGPRAGGFLRAAKGRANLVNSSLRHRPPLSLENTVLVQMGVFFTFATWAFGGNAEWVKTALAWWGLAGALLIPAAILTARARVNLKRLSWLIPLALFNGVVLLSAQTPGLRMLQAGAENFYAVNAIPAWRPSAAVPAWS